MPGIYAKYHSNFLESFIETFESNILNNERMLFAKNKMNFIFPFMLFVRVQI